MGKSMVRTFYTTCGEIVKELGYTQLENDHAWLLDSPNNSVFYTSAISPYEWRTVELPEEAHRIDLPSACESRAVGISELPEAIQMLLLVGA